MDQRIDYLLSTPSLQLSPSARTDIESGQLNTRLLAVLVALSQKHTISVSVIKTGHPIGAKTPGGFVNDHYYYRALDITAVDDKPIEGHGNDPAILDIGRTLSALPSQERPDCIFGPEEWHSALGYPASTGFISDPFHNSIHRDHLHLGFESEVGTDKQE